MLIDRNRQPHDEPAPKKDEWFKDMLAHGQGIWVFPSIAVIAILTGLLLPGLAKLKSATSREQVVVYTSQDQVYAEPILTEFENESGIKVRAVYDSEAVKTVGLANRLLAEKSHPQCDVFWNNEELRTRQLAAQGVFRSDPGFLPIGYRARRLVINTNVLPLASAPRTLTALTNQAWRSKVALSYPLFGTTATHFLALRQQWGEGPWKAWCRAIQANQPFIVDGNSVVVKLVGSGECWIGLTDSDDVAAGQREGLPVVGIAIADGNLLIPNTVAVIRDCPHPATAQKLFDYLFSKAAKKLAAVHAIEGVVWLGTTNAPEAGDIDPGSVLKVPPMVVDGDGLLRDLDRATATLKEIFLR